MTSIPSTVGDDSVSAARERLRQGAAVWPQLALLALVGLAAALRFGYLEFLQVRQGFSWHDPDHYLQAARSLTRTGAWQWHVDAVTYIWGGQAWTMSPAYPVFLSVFYRAPSYDPMAAAIAQILLASAAVIAVYWLGVALHGVRTGVVAALLYATWFPSVTGVAVFNQEAVYLPLLAAAFALLAVGWVSGARPWVFAAAGMIFAVAILARAVPFYFLPGLFLLLAIGRGRASGRQVAGYAAGLAVVLVPYIVFISVERGHLILIDDHGVIQSTGQLRTERITVAESARIFLATLTDDLAGKWELVRAHFQVHGRSWIYHYGWAPDEARAAWVRPVVTVWLDWVFVVTAILAPWGFALARSAPLSRLLAAWSVFAILLSAAAGFGGARYRTPIEFALIVGVAVVCTANWVRWRRLAMSGAAVCAVVMAWFVVPQVLAPRQMQAAYGLAQWTFLSDGRWVSSASGPVGFNVPTGEAGIRLQLEPIASVPPPRAYSVMVDGQPVESELSESGAVMVRVPIQPDLHYIQIRPELPPAGGMFRIMFVP